MSTKILSPGEIAVGQKITILEHDEIEMPSGGMGLLGLGTMTTTRPSWGLGEVFNVTSVMLPYVVVESGDHYLFPRTLDTRVMRLMEVTPEYEAATKRKIT